jgi:enoyl-CoA hydratase
MNYIKYEQRGLVGILTIDRQNALNALNSDVISELEQALDRISMDDTRCLILTGAGEKSFVAGADIGEMSALTKAEGEKFGKKGNDVFRKIEIFPLPIIAAVNGYALGGGCELAMACDIRIASENAVFAQPEASLGITAGFGGTQRLPRLIGLGKAKELLYTTSKIKAEEALKLGLVNAVYPQNQLMDECINMADKIAKNAPIAVRATKKAVNEGMQVDMDTAIHMEAELFGSCFETQDQTNAMKAFVEKLKPSPFENK